jgi:uncharacterized protein YbjQ (UPF0145 family)
MTLANLLSESQIIPEMASKERWDAIRELGDRLVEAGKVDKEDREDVLESIRQREEALRHVVALNTRYVPEGVAATGAQLVTGGVVVSSDYFKTFVAGFRAFFGGRFRGYETLLERARREALLRLKEDAQAAGATLVIGVRFQSTTIAGSSTPSVEVLAFGTALRTAS